MTKQIGIVACSAEGAALCYLTICTEGANLMGKYAHPEVTIHTHPLSEYMKHITVGNWKGVAKLMLSSAKNLANVGANFIVCPDNTIHQAYNLVVKKSPLPWLHIAEVVIDEAKRHKYKCLGVIGTLYLMQGPVYRDKLAAAGMEYILPDKQDQTRINEIIFNELVNGQFTAKSRAYLSKVIDKLKKQGCDAVILGCTELPLLITQKDSSIPILDSARLLARAALRRAIGSELSKKV